MKRLKKLRAKLEVVGLEALLISQAENRRYLSGFDGTAGYLIISQEQALLATDFRYTEQARFQARGFEVEEVKGEPEHWLPPMLQEQGIRALGFESQDMNVALYGKLKEALSSITLVPTQRLVEELRMVKEKEELALIEKAAKLADEAMKHIAEVIEPGMREKELAWEGEKFLRERGSQSPPFDLIVASGPNSALPHAKPSDRPMGKGEPVVIDIGAKVDGYSSDLTRTLYLGDPDPTFRRIYGLVVRAQSTAQEKLEEGMRGEEADALARRVIEQAGFGPAFGHGLGHGVGLATHEDPRLGKESQHILGEGMVFTLEPGIYISGWGGVRIEDLVVLEKGRARVLSHSTKLKF